MAIQLGMLAGAVGGQLLGMATQGMQDRRQIKQQQKLQDMQVKGNKEMADYNQRLQYDMWNKTNYGAQMQHIKEAGLNPGMLYGMGGAGGATAGGSGGAGVSGGQAASGVAGQQAQMAMGMQIAQLKLIEAQTEKTKAEADKTKGVDTEQSRATTGVLNTTNELKIIERDVAKGTQNEAIGRIVADAEKAMFEARSAEVDSQVAQESKETRVEQVKATLTATIQSVENAKKAGNLMEAETVIKNFEAELTKQGIAPNSPWYIKIVTGLLESVGLGVTKGVDNVKKVMQ